MNRMLVCMASLAASVALSAVEPKVECADPGSWKIETECVASGDVAEFVVRMKSATPAVPPRFTLSFDLPQVDAHHKWVPNFEQVTLPPDWGGRTESRLCKGIPLVAYLNDDDRNRACVAVSEAKRTVKMQSGLREEDCHLIWKIDFFTEPEAPISNYETRLRVDVRDVFFGDAIREGTEWIERTAGLKPAEAPESAFDPLYSTWYSFHQNVFDRDVEAECAAAAKLGMKTVIVDDGWQTDDNNRGYAFTGDWEISKRRFPDMAAHVRKVHELGMKYMIWYGVPMVGDRAKCRARFEGKTLWRNGSGSWSCLDPRFPEVRAYLIGLYARALEEWGLDGLKLDFIDSFEFHGPDPAVAENYAGRDIRSLPEAVDRLMKDVFAALKAVKPDAFVEFRQLYMGPGVRQYGNMMRAADCPGDLMANRCRTANLRLTSGRTAVHSDMLEWNPDETPESAARFVLSSIFSVIQYSVMLRTLPESHRRMVAHWIGFSQAHRKALLKGAFRPHHYEQNYPWIESEDDTERIVGVYSASAVADCGMSNRTVYVLNGTGTDRVTLRLSAAPRAIESFDTFGIRREPPILREGVQDVRIPVSGYLKLAP